MTDNAGKSRGTRRAMDRTMALAISLVLAGALLLTAIPTAWATGDAAPLRQDGTIGPAPTAEKVKNGGGGGGQASAAPQETVGVPVDMRLGPGDGVFALPRPNNGCIQVNVSGLPVQLLFQITPMAPGAASSLPAGCRATSVVYVLKAWNGQTGQEAVEISPDYTHTVCYTEADLAVANGDPNNFVLAYYDEAAQGWADLTPITIDAVNRHVIGQASHASWWALFACEAAPAPLTLPETGHAPGRVPAFAVVGLLLLGVGGWLGLRSRGSDAPSAE